MRRSISYKENINRSILFIILVAYESLTSIYTYMTPLFGVVFCYLVFNIQNEEKRFPVALAFMYMVFFEADKGFYLFSIFLFFLIYYFFVANKLEKIISDKKYILFLLVAGSYIGYYLFNFFIAYLLNQEAPFFGIEYILYIVVDFLIAMVVF